MTAYFLCLNTYKIFQTNHVKHSAMSASDGGTNEQPSDKSLGMIFFANEFGPLVLEVLTFSSNIFIQKPLIHCR